MATIIQPAKGTRDCYPADTLRRRYIEKAWRSASIRHGFEEIEGPTFEPSDLYAIKSGEGILGELFQAFSGKSPEEVEQVRESGRAPYALRPEFTPTLARMYAARSKELTQPCKWFSVGPYFRAERPQRGRLREFLQWNVDVVGLPGDGDEHAAQLDAETIETCIGLLRSVGLGSGISRVHASTRANAAALLYDAGLDEAHIDAGYALLDRWKKLSPPERATQSQHLGIDAAALDRAMDADAAPTPTDIEPMVRELEPGWLCHDPAIVRGLAYYTGTVFEVIADGERAVAGGGRYDNLIELMGGPPTPAVGFAMGDVVLGLLLDDHGLMPEGAELMDAVSAPEPSRRPEVFVINGGNKDDADQLDPTVRRLTSDLRRGVEGGAYQERAAKNDGTANGSAKPWHRDRYDRDSGGIRPLHARHTYKSTRNLKKILSDAEKQHSICAAIVHEPEKVQLKHLDTRRDLTPADIAGMPSDIAEFSINPQSPVYVGRAVDALLRP